MAIEITDEKSVASELRMIQRGLEMSAAIMRDTHRTNGWEGAERVARSYERYAVRIAAVAPLIEAQAKEIERLQLELAEERAKHALTLMNYDQQSADLAPVRAAAPKAEG